VSGRGRSKAWLLLLLLLLEKRLALHWVLELWLHTWP